jgi:integrase
MARRGHNEGSISKRKDGRWEGRISLGYEGDTRKRKAFYGKTRREVQQQLTKALRDHQQGLPVAPERQTVATFLTSWLKASVRLRVRPRTHDSYEQLVRIHLPRAPERIHRTKLSPNDVQDFMNRKLASGLSPRAVEYCRAVMRNAI